VDSAGHFLGRGLYNPLPALCCRILTRRDESLDAHFLRRRVAAAVTIRSAAGAVPALARLVWSEADGLPGLVADRYGPVLVIQCLTLGMARRRAELVEALRAAVGDLPAISADEPGPAGLEGFEAVRGWFDRQGPASVVVEEGTARFTVTPGRGHKTGLYLDQGANRRRLAGLAHGRDVLDAFCYGAGFACHALLGGARRAVCVESSPEALAAARENLALNGVADRAEVVAANVFDDLRARERARQSFGLVVLDPPPFARRRDMLEGALRGYKEINLRAMRLLVRGGVLATFSCSHHLADAAFEEVCRQAGADAGVTLRVLDRLSQAPDHPELLTVPETRYLKGLLLEAT